MTPTQLGELGICFSCKYQIPINVSAGWAAFQGPDLAAG